MLFLSFFFISASATLDSVDLSFLVDSFVPGYSNWSDLWAFKHNRSLLLDWFGQSARWKYWCTRRAIGRKITRMRQPVYLNPNLRSRDERTVCHPTHTARNWSTSSSKTSPTLSAVVSEEVSYPQTLFVTYWIKNSLRLQILYKNKVNLTLLIINLAQTALMSKSGHKLNVLKTS